MWPSRTKIASLPVNRTANGYEQRASYSHPDLLHEHVIELESPFATIARDEVKVLTFLLLGDQNAGKSTFLHAFTYDNDTNWLQIVSRLPILSSSFVNCRYAAVQSSASSAATTTTTPTTTTPTTTTTTMPSATTTTPPPAHIMDEAPFIDSDLGCVAFTVTREDFLFYLSESYEQEQASNTATAIDNDDDNGDDDGDDAAAAGSRAQQRLLATHAAFADIVHDSSIQYVCVRLLEMGGDHLDRLMAARDFRGAPRAAAAAALDARFAAQPTIVQQSLRVLTRDARRQIYFVNARSLVDTSSGECVTEAWHLLFARFAFIANACAHQDRARQSSDSDCVGSSVSDAVDVMLYVSRADEVAAVFASAGERFRAQVAVECARAVALLAPATVSNNAATTTEITARLAPIENAAATSSLVDFVHAALRSFLRHAQLDANVRLSERAFATQHLKQQADANEQHSLFPSSLLSLSQQQQQQQQQVGALDASNVLRTLSRLLLLEMEFASSADCTHECVLATLRYFASHETSLDGTDHVDNNVSAMNIDDNDCNDIINEHREISSDSDSNTTLVTLTQLDLNEWLDEEQHVALASPLPAPLVARAFPDAARFLCAIRAAVRLNELALPRIVSLSTLGMHKGSERKRKSQSASAAFAARHCAQYTLRPQLAAIVKLDSAEFTHNNGDVDTEGAKKRGDILFVAPNVRTSLAGEAARVAAADSHAHVPLAVCTYAPFIHMLLEYFERANSAHSAPQRESIDLATLRMRARERALPSLSAAVCGAFRRAASVRNASEACFGAAWQRFACLALQWQLVHDFAHAAISSHVDNGIDGNGDAVASIVEFSSVLECENTGFFESDVFHEAFVRVGDDDDSGVNEKANARRRRHVLFSVQD